MRKCFPFQSTHPRGVRRWLSSPSSDTQKISIHAPTWGATNRQKHVYRNRVISIHAPTWGATWQYFDDSMDTSNISIHAPTWGATQCKGTANFCNCISIHAPTWGATSDHSSPGRLLRNFNPRTHVGCDLFPGLTRVWRTISIHAPTWGATQQHRRHLVPHHLISIHAPTWGATAPSSSSPPVLFYFNPRTHVGCDTAQAQGM